MSSSSDKSPLSAPIKKRRSSILSRKSIGPAVLNSRESSEERLAIATKEVREWKNLAKERRKLSKISEAALTETKENPPTLDFESVKADLTQEDIEFLKNKPDYAKLSKDFDLFFEKLGMLNEMTETLNKGMVCTSLIAEGRLKEISKNICSYNDSAPLQ